MDKTSKEVYIMTEQNYQYRTSQNLLRNQFDGDGPFQIPIIPKASFSEKEFQELMLIGFDKARADDEKNRDRMVHFFCMTISLSEYGKMLHEI